MEHWREHNDFVASAEHFFNRTSNGVEEYSVVAELGSGSFGTAYSAVRGHYTRAEIFLAGMKPQFVIKLHRRRHGLTLEKTYEHARHEYEVSVLIDSIGREANDEICGVSSVCAFEIFVDREYVITVFPYENATDLERYMFHHLYDSWTTTDVQAQREYQIEVLKIAIWLLEAVRRINALQIYHIDLKPANVIVSHRKNGDSLLPTVRGLKLIDFGFSCAVRSPLIERLLPSLQLGDIYDAVSCHARGKNDVFMYEPTPEFRDPLAGHGFRGTPQSAQFQFTRDQVFDLWPKFEMFSCAIIIQLLVDPLQNSTSEHAPRIVLSNGGVPRIRRTSRSPAGLKSVLLHMTGPLAHRESAANYAIILSHMLTQLQRGDTLQRIDDGPRTEYDE